MKNGDMIRITTTDGNEYKVTAGADSLSFDNDYRFSVFEETANGRFFKKLNTDEDDIFHIVRIQGLPRKVRQ